MALTKVNTDLLADGGKLNGIEAGADVTDTTNVTAAGALMDSELTSIASVKALDQGVATTDSPTFANITATGIDITSTIADGTFIRSSHATTTNAYITNTNATTGNTANLYLAPANNVAGAYISAIATEDFSVSANRSADMAFYTRNNGNFGERLKLTSTGIDVTGTIITDGLEIGNTSNSYSAVYIMSSATGESELRMGDTDTDAGSIAYTNSDDTMTFRAAAGARMTLDATGIDVTGTATMDGLTVGDVGLTGLLALTGDRGTFVDSSENSTIPHIFATNDAVGDFSQEAGHLIIQPRVHTSVYRDIIFAGGTTNAKRLMTIQGEGDISFYEDTGTTPKLFWDASAESLGIGTSSPKTTLNLAANNSGQGAILTLENTDTSLTTNDVVGQIDFYGNDGSTGGTGQKATIQAIAQNGSGTSVGLIFGTSAFPNTAATERMRIDSSGNVLVGTTATDTAAVGFRYRSSLDAISSVADGGISAYFGRRTSDGDIVAFRKDDAIVGSIQSRAGLVSTIILDPRTNGAGLTGSTNGLIPVNQTGSTADNHVDLGSSSSRFKNLYLSSGVYLGGTGAANKLDSYEEGTFTSTTSNNNLTAYGSFTGRYTKVGNIVHITGSLPGITAGTGNRFFVFSAPFAQYTSSNFSSGTCTNYPKGNRRSGIVINNSSSNNTQFYVAWNNDSAQSSSDLSFQITYETT